jgi:hypothetical protein
MYVLHNTVRDIPLSITNKMQRYTIFFIPLNALHVSGCFSAHHQELKPYTQHLVYVKLLAATASVGDHAETCTALTAIKNIV